MQQALDCANISAMQGGAELRQILCISLLSKFHTVDVACPAGTLNFLFGIPNLNIVFYSST
jgi:hypothetical protein